MYQLPLDRALELRKRYTGDVDFASHVAQMLSRYSMGAHRPDDASGSAVDKWYVRGASQELLDPLLATIPGCTKQRFATPLDVRPAAADYYL